MNIAVTRPGIAEQSVLTDLFRVVITDAFEADGIGDRLDGIEEEIAKQAEFLAQDFASDGKEVHFLAARLDEQIVGTIAHQKPNALLERYVDADLSTVPEITSVLVLPEWQNRGVGTLLFRTMLHRLHDLGAEKFCLDGGYKKSQSFWIKQLGSPDVTLQDHYGEGLDYMIWVRELDKFL